MNTKAYFELAAADSVGRSPATIFERIKWWISISKLTHDGKTFCFRTYEQLAEEVGVSISTARRAIARLIDMGWLEKVKLKAKQWNQTNCYTFGPNAPESASTSRTTRSVHSESLDNSKTDSSIHKKSFIQRKIKEAQAKARSITKGFKKDTSKGSHCSTLCKACQGSGIVADENNQGYRCLCADGRSKSTQIPQVPEALFLSLRNQMA